MIGAQMTAETPGSAWGYSYDGFGHPLAKKVTQRNATARWSGGADPNTKRAGAAAMTLTATSSPVRHAELTTWRIGWPA
jgi:YD repeat-containing protein